MTNAQATRTEPTPQWIAIDEYVRLLTSRHNLVRLSDDRGDWSGLLDTDVGICYAVENRVLLNYQCDFSRSTS